MQQKKAWKFDYFWVILALCFLVIFTSMGLCSSNRAIYLTAITDALDLPRSAFSLNDTFRYIATTVVNLFFGVLVARFGTKKLLCAGFCCLIGFALINATATELYQFYIGGILLGVGFSWTGTTMVSTIINRWCTGNKGAFTGAVLAANGIGGAIAVQIISPIIFEEGNPFGYRNSYRLVALLLAIALVLVLIFYREKQGEHPIAKKKHKMRGESWEGLDFQQVVRKPYFYVSLVCMFLIGITLQGLGGIAVPHMYDIGLDVSYVAMLVSLGGILLTCSKFVVGFLYDRLGIRITANISLVCAMIAVVALAFLSNTPTGRIFAFVRYLFNAIAMPLETVMVPLFVAEFFGNKSFEKAVGIFISATTAGMALGTPFSNLFYDVFGSYNAAFLIFGGSVLLVLIVIQFVFKAAKKDREAVLSK